MKKLILACLAIVAGGAVYYFVWGRGDGAAADAAAARVVVAVERGRIAHEVGTTGRVVANLDVDIKCKASGQVTKLPFEVSDAVKQGDLLLELDPVDEQRVVDQAEVALKASQARLAQAEEGLIVAESAVALDRRRAQTDLVAAEATVRDAEAKAARAQQLFDKKLIAEEELVTAQTVAVQAQAALDNARLRLDELDAEERALEVKRQDVALANTDVRSDEIALDIARQRLADTRVLSPIDGVVATRDVQIGQIISSGISNVGGGTAVLTLSDLSRIFVLASVDESDIGQVDVGHKAVVTVDAFPRVRFPGKVVRIATRGINEQNVVTFEVKIEVLSDKKGLLKPEMTANVDIVIAEREDAVLVPVGAVTRGAEGAFVEVVAAGAGGAAGEAALPVAGDKRQVRLGVSDGAFFEVIEGLEEGDSVLLQGTAAASRWRPGADGDSSGRSQRAMGRMMMRAGRGR